MKVIKQGRRQKGWSVETKCTGDGNGGGGCGSVLLVEQKDIYTTERHCRDETDTFYTFQCVSCNVETDLSTAPPRNIMFPDKAKWLRYRED